MAIIKLTSVEHNKNEDQTNVGMLVEWFLHKEPMSHKKIQKLAYYVQAWSITLDDKDIVPSVEFEAWIHGPVNLEIWHRCKDFGWRDIMISEDDQEESFKQVELLFTERQKELLDLVWETYGDYSADELESMTHEEDPWKNAREGLSRFDRTRSKISNESMKTYYKDKFNYV